MRNESRLMGRPLHAGVSAVDEIALAEDVSRLSFLPAPPPAALRARVGPLRDRPFHFL